MREWSFKNNIKVIEEEFDFDLHSFKVYDKDRYLGSIYPNDLKSMESCISDLENGIDPISGGWEDGCGHTCNINGWDK